MKYELKFLPSEKDFNKIGLYLILHKNQIIDHYQKSEELENILKKILSNHIQDYPTKDFKFKIH